MLLSAFHKVFMHSCMVSRFHAHGHWWKRHLITNRKRTDDPLHSVLLQQDGKTNDDGKCMVITRGQSLNAANKLKLTCECLWTQYSLVLQTYSQPLLSAHLLLLNFDMKNHKGLLSLRVEKKGTHTSNLPPTGSSSESPTFNSTYINVLVKINPEYFFFNDQATPILLTYRKEMVAVVTVRFIRFHPFNFSAVGSLGCDKWRARSDPSPIFLSVQAVMNGCMLIVFSHRGQTGPLPAVQHKHGIPPIHLLKHSHTHESRDWTWFRLDRSNACARIPCWQGSQWA